MIIVVDVVVVVVFVVDEEKLRRKWRKTFEKGKLIGTPTNQQDVCSVICLFKKWKIEGRDL